MKKSLFFWQILGFLCTGTAGVILHFLFDWTNQNIAIAPFSAVNESIWEHMKLLFFPMLLFAIIEYRCIGKDYESFWCVKLIGIVLGFLLIPILYYTINGIFGATPDFINIAIFYIASAISYTVESWLIKKNIITCKSSKKALGILALIAVVFIIFTFMPPKIPIFKDPITNTYGFYQIL